MNYKKNLFPLVLCILSFSCETDNIEPKYPSVYRKSGLRITSDLRIFSSKGEIKVKSIIRRYTEIDTSSYNRFAEYIKNEVGIIDTIKFLDRENAVVNHNYEPNHYLVLS